MKDQINLEIKGHITISSNKDGIIYDNHNTISGNSLEIILKCLSQLGGTPKHVDNISVTGPFGLAVKAIDNFTYTADSNKVTFSTEFVEDDFNGTITDMKLYSQSLLGLELASKTGLNVTKDDQTRLRVDWSITINNC